MAGSLRLDDSADIAPQPGPQEEFLATPADIAIYGGAAGGGKTFAILLEPLRNVHNPKFRSVIFRRNSVQVRNAGGLWDESMQIYPLVGAEPRSHMLEWQFPSGATLRFAHLENEQTVLSWQGSQIPLIGFDELTHFTKKQFFYMLSRNRSTSGVRGYIRATTNPDANSWVREFIDWYIAEDGYVDLSRAGQVRWFVRYGDDIVWADTPEELKEKFGDDADPKSFTYIPSNIYDNKILLSKDPSYLSNLKALSKVDRERLLGDKKRGGNWNVIESAGLLFNRSWFGVLDILPTGWSRAVRYWDRAATKPGPANPDPDWTRGLLLFEYSKGFYVVADLRSMRDTPGKVETFIRNVASQDGRQVEILSQQDPGSAGVAESENFVRMLSGYIVRTEVIGRDKVTRSKPVSAQAEYGNIFILRGSWNEEFFTELENFPDGNHDDIVDVLSGAFNYLTGKTRTLLDNL